MVGNVTDPRREEPITIALLIGHVVKLMKDGSTEYRDIQKVVLNLKAQFGHIQIESLSCQI